MNFLTPAFLALAALAGPIVLLYMLRLRRREVTVSSTMLWQMVLRDREANTPWQRLRRNLLLLLQLLLLALIVLALARPFWPVPVVAAGQVTLLIDGSLSMQAEDVSPNRFEVARQTALQLVDGLDSNSEMSVILVGRQPEVLASSESDPDLLRQIVSDIQPGFGEADWGGALAIAAASADNASGATTVIISDGGLPEGLPIVPGEVRYVPVGAEDTNVAIAAMSIRPDANGPQLFVSVRNYGSTLANPVLSVYLGEELLLLAKQLELAPGASAGEVFALPDGAGVVRATLDSPALNPSNDFLSQDNEAWTVYAPSQRGRVLYVSQRGNLFIEQVLAALPGVEAFRAPPDQPLPEEPFDLYVFDGVVPDELPPAEVLLIAPPDNALFAVNGVYAPESDPVLTADPDAPFNAFVDWQSVQFLEINAAEVPAWASTAAALDGWPLLFGGTLDNRRVAVLTFDPRNSDMPLQVSFPILFANLIDWLTPNTVIDSDSDIIRPGDPVIIRPDVGVTGVAVRDPEGSVFRAVVGEGGARFLATDLPGVYTVSDQNGVVGQFAVNAFAGDESQIAPQANITVGQSPLTAAERDAVGQRELWPWLAALAMLVLLIEWWAYHRRQVLPGNSGAVIGWLRRLRGGSP